jgi:chromosome segregation ATPase
VRLDAFTRVKKAIDDMIGNLLDEKDAEIKTRDNCIEELNTNEKQTAKELHTKTNLQTKIEGLEMNIKGLNTTINTMKEEIAELETQKKRASEDRAAQKADFDGTVADQRETQVLLQKAYDTLKEVYESKTAEPSLLQKKTAQTPPAEFSSYEKNKGGSGVLALLEHIMNEAKAMEAEAIQAEQDSRDAYDKFKQDTTDSIAAKQDAITDRTSEMSRDQGLLTETKSEYDGTVAELEALAKDEGDLHASCDYVLKNFEARQEARDQEVEALRQAKAYLSGME